MATRAPDCPSPWVADVVLAVATALVIAVVIAADGAGVGSAGPAAYLFAVVFGALVLLRRRAPRVMLVATFLAVCVYYALGFSPIGMVLPAVAALYAAAERGRTGWSVGTGTVLIVVATYFRLADDADPSAYLTAYDLVTNLALTAAAVALGSAVRLTREARERTEQVRTLTAAEETHAAAERLQAERLRIARDLHDTLGHTLSVVTLHAGVAAEAVGRDDDAARTALEHVRTATSGTLDELRSTVKVLRSPSASSTSGDADAVDAPPRPRGATGLAGLDALVRPARAAGLGVEVELDVPEHLPATVDAAAFRVVQESLTNVLRHAGARHARVRAVVDGERLHITVSDDGRGTREHAGEGTPADGAGIAGMRERVGLLGGTLAVGTAPGGGFAVVAELPTTLPG